MKWLIQLVGIISNASASVLIKLAMLPPRKFPTVADPLSLLRNWPLCLGLFLYGATFLLYAAALAKLPLNVAHPILTAGAVGTVALASAFLLREPFPWTTTLGVGLVAAGVALISLAAH
jgi:multidrug transporter EmrE-like cation transporter